MSYITHFAISLLFFLVPFISRQSRLNDSEALKFVQFEFISQNIQDHSNFITKMRDRNIPEKQIANFVWSSKIFGWKKIQRGRYFFDGSYSFLQILEILGRGIQDPIKIIVLPGIDEDTFSESIASKMNFEAKQLKEALTDSSVLSQVGVKPGFLFPRMLPDTYAMYWTYTPEQVILRINESFAERVEKKYQERFLTRPYSLNNVLTMASIVEWEAGNEEEKKTISGLYWNRIKRGWRLQADPTVNFALGQRRRLTFEDYKTPHPYNTYLKRGFPPSPINNPSYSSIEAALFPEEHRYMYMVASPEGGHIFTSTLEEHNRASEQWRQWLRKQYRIKRQKEAEAASR